LRNRTFAAVRDAGGVIDDEAAAISDAVAPPAG
jgi:hypothetical protein